MTSRLCSLLLVLFLLSQILAPSRLAFDWHGMTHIHERLRQGNTRGIYIVDVVIAPGPGGDVCLMTFWWSNHGVVEIGVPMGDGENGR